jgi:GxxExxY protein
MMASGSRPDFASTNAQLLTYMKLTGRRLGFLVNFNKKLIKDGIQRIAL